MKKENKMLDKNFRDTKAVVKLLLNRNQGEIVKIILEALSSFGIIMDEDVSDLTNKKQICGSFWFFAKSRFAATCCRCRKSCPKNHPLCISFTKEPFCIECLTDDEKANPNLAYKKFLEGDDEAPASN